MVLVNYDNNVQRKAKVTEIIKVYNSVLLFSVTHHVVKSLKVVTVQKINLKTIKTYQ